MNSKKIIHPEKILLSESFRLLRILRNAGPTDSIVAEMAELIVEYMETGSELTGKKIAEKKMKQTL
ncbi:MAG: hypothetical protein IPP60_13420 [Sphingobacteriales bacterium]|nr:hypothetical protein [Sphingobacteriales bacterium]